jgi:hypothetical protein
MFAFVNTGYSLLISFMKTCNTFRELSSTRLSQFNSGTEKCVPDGSQKCSQMNTSKKTWLLLCRFWNVTTESVMKSWTRSSQEMRLGSRTTYQRVSDSLKIDIVPTPRQIRPTKIQGGAFNCKIMANCFGQERHSVDLLHAPWKEH